MCDNNIQSIQKTIRCLLIIVTLVGNVFYNSNYAYSNSKVDSIKNDIQNLIAQFASTMNLRKKLLISNFINYYVDDNALFEKTSMLLNSDDESIVQTKKTYKLNKNQYIEHLYTIVSYPIQYAFLAQISNINIDKEKQFAIATIYIEENAISNTQTNMNVKTVVSTNCNFSFNIQRSPPSILGNNCIEKIVIK